MTVGRAFSFGALLAAAAFLTSIALFKVVDSDVWWHIKAGQLMWDMKGLIETDPFAYTRAGQPYLATHEWLTQLIFAGAYGIGGAAGIVWLRILCLLAIGAILLSTDRKNIWPNALLLIAGAIVMRQGLLERPQMLSNVIFAGVVWIGLRLLDEAPNSPRSRTPGRVLLVGLLGLQILWVNIHGAAAILTFIVPGVLFVQRLSDLLTGRASRGEVSPRWGIDRNLLSIILLGIALLLAMFVSPNLHHNFTYLWLLLTDNTATFIKEWAPHPWPQYLRLHGAFWAIAFASLLCTRRHTIAVGLLLLLPGVLSRMGSRHEVLFTIAALACTFYELKHNETWQQFLERARERWIASALASIVILAGLWYTDEYYQVFVRRNNLRGFGAFAPAEGAAEFMLREGLGTEKIYNTYAVGGYLLFRGIPVFMDGRNVDYGYDYLNEALEARHRPVILRRLEERYGFTTLVIEHGWTNRGSTEFTFLKEDPLWALVFLDDWAAVYVKRTPEHQSLIARREYRLLTPHAFTDGSILTEVPTAQWQELQQELLRVIAPDPRGIFGLLRLAELAASTGAFEPAMTAIAEVIRRAPERYEPYALAARITAAQEEWAQAGAYYEQAITRTRGLDLTLNYAQIADVFERAGEAGKAEKYRRMAE